MAAPEERLAVERDVRVEAPPESVFKFFVEPEQMVRWMGVEATLDPRPGGIFRVDVTGREVARGEYVEVVPNERVVFSWGWEDPSNPLAPGASTVEVTLESDRGATIVRLRHYGLPGGAEDPHAQGWEHYLARLVLVASGRDPGEDRWVTNPPR